MFTVDTTPLTVDGWKGYSQLSTKDKVATFNRSNGEIEYQTPIEITWKKNYEGELINIKGRDTNQLLTFNHQVLLKFKSMKNYQRRYWDSNWSFELAKALPKVIKAKGWLQLQLAGKYKQGTLSSGQLFNIKSSRIKASHLLSELLGWIITDGHFPKTGRAIEIDQIDKFEVEHFKKVIRIWNVLNYLKETLNIKFSVTPYPKEWKGKPRINYRFYLNVSNFTDRIRRIIPNKRPIWELLQLQPSELIYLFKGLMGGDSSLYAKSNRKKDGKLPNHCTFAQKDSFTRAWFQALACLIGVRGNEYIPKEKTPLVTICGRDTIQITNSDRNRKPHVTVKKPKKSLKVWGVETKNQTVVCRRTVSELNRKGEKVRKSYVFITGATTTD